MDSVTIIYQPISGAELEPVGGCWKFAVYDASVKDMSTVNGEVRCEPEEVCVTIKNGVCKEFDCPFNTMHYFPVWLRR